MQHMTETQRVMLIAGLAGADVRTVKRFVSGKLVKGAVLRERIEAATRRADELEAPPAQKANG